MLCSGSEGCTASPHVDTRAHAQRGSVGPAPEYFKYGVEGAEGMCCMVTHLGSRNCVQCWGKWLNGRLCLWWKAVGMQCSAREGREGSGRGVGAGDHVGPFMVAGCGDAGGRG